MHLFCVSQVYVCTIHKAMKSTQLAHDRPDRKADTHHTTTRHTRRFIAGQILQLPLVQFTRLLHVVATLITANTAPCSLSSALTLSLSHISSLPHALALPPRSANFLVAPPKRTPFDLHLSNHMSPTFSFPSHICSISVSVFSISSVSPLSLHS